MEQISNEVKIAELTATVKDTTLGGDERRAALRHLCTLRGDVYQHVDDADLSHVIAGMTAWPVGMKQLSLRDSAEAVQEGRRRATAAQKHA